MPLPTPIDSSDFFSFDMNNLNSLVIFSKKDTPYPTIKHFFNIEQEIIINSNYPSSKETNKFVNLNDYDVNNQMEMEWYQESKFTEWQMAINMCEDCIPPPPNVIIKPNPPPPLPPQPKLYYFTGLHPITKVFTGWSSFSKSSKRPEGEAQDFLQVVRVG